MFKLCLCHVHILFKIVEYTNYNKENKESKKQFRYNRRNEICIIQMKIKGKTKTTSMKMNTAKIHPMHKNQKMWNRMQQKMQKQKK